MARIPDQAARSRILDAAEACATESRTPSIADIARRAGLSRGSVYRRFGSAKKLREALGAERQIDPLRLNRPAARERILDAMSTVLNRDGLHGLTIEAIAGAASVGTATVYRQFGDRAGLFDAFANERSPRMLRPLLEAAPGRNIEKDLGAFVAEVLTLFELNPALLRLVVATPAERQLWPTAFQGGPDSLRRALRNYLEARIEMGQLTGDSQQLAELLVGIIVGKALGHFGGTSVSIEARARSIVESFLYGCATRRKRRRT